MRSANCKTHHLPTWNYRGTSLTRKRSPLGPYRRPMPRALRWSWQGGLFLMSEVPLYCMCMRSANCKAHHFPAWNCMSATSLRLKSRLVNRGGGWLFSLRRSRRATHLVFVQARFVERAELGQQGANLHQSAARLMLRPERPRHSTRRAQIPPRSHPPRPTA